MKNTCKLLLCTAMIASLCGCTTSKGNPDEQARFDAFIEKDFIETMESDYLTMHIYLEHPEDYGIDLKNVPVTLGTDPDEEGLKEMEASFQKTVDTFESFHRDDLTKEQQETYDICKYMIDINKTLNDDQFAYYENLFASMGGIHYQLPVLLSDYSLRNEQDVKDLIILMQDIKPYIDSCLEYTKKQEEKGLMMIDFEDVLTYIDNLLANKDNSSVLTALYESVDKLNLKDGDQYKQQIETQFRESFIPAYEEMRSVLSQLRDKGTNNENGLWAFENGKEYYEALLKQAIGSNKSIDEIKKLLNDEMEEAMNDMQKAAMKDLEAVMAFIEGEMPTTDFTSYDEILKANKELMAKEFPAVSDIQYNIRDISKDIASDSGIAAYFNIPPIDHSGTKELRVNPNNADISSLSTYSTVSHEGFPGHMYQYAYMYENLDNSWRKTIANCDAFTEGYAVYAQYEAFDYLDDDISDAILEVYKTNELASYCIIMLADIGIHYDGWDFDQFMNYLTTMGFALEEEDARKQYNQLWANPAAFQPYYVGYLEISNLKEKAQEELGDKFSELDFHKALLSGGNAPFNVVEENINDYINENA